ncbi:MAG: pseudouridine-5-phosphate glycosidase [Treponema sp.]|nr:MAG: pseudouridine-5-phosphate glycosidase [Treponema sp.]
MNQYLDIKDDVKEAIANNKPVVALESTIISHGMPYPKNVETALEAEQIVRDTGAVPATMAIINGRLKAGLTEDEIDYFGKKGLEITKASRRDIPVLISKKQDGATTVAATMILADLAGIKVFATGGIGGVHRNAEATMDISADLSELAQTNVLVVCAGAKSILDLGLTLEVLETNGVPVIGYKTKTLPAFFTSESDFEVLYKMDTTEEIAKAFKASTQLGFKGGFLVANPIPKEYSMDKNYIAGVIEKAIKDADNKKITGKELTPFLLDAIVKATEGKSLESNIKLVYNNVKVASQIAVDLSKLAVLSF